MKFSARNLSAWVVANFLIACGFVRRARTNALKGNYILSVYFHKPSRKEFERCVKWLQMYKFNFISTADLEQIILKRTSFPKAAILLTVDDGWQSNAKNIVEVSQKYKVPVTIFISTEPVEEGNYWWSYWQRAVQLGVNKLPTKKTLKHIPNNIRRSIIDNLKKEALPKRDALTIEQVRTVSNHNYITIGAHTHTHPILINCCDDEVYEELELSKSKLEAWTGKKVCYFAYPNGDYSKREMTMLKEVGYKLAYCSEPRYLTPDVVQDRYKIPRFGFLEGASFAENKCRMMGVWKNLKVP